MALTSSDQVSLGSEAPGFKLQATDGSIKSLATYSDARVLGVVFMCNHCPYVQAVDDRINQLAREFQSQGVRIVGINPNDSVKYPLDSFDHMVGRAREKNYGFDYLHDPTQDVARAYGAVCTPDPYLFENVNGRFLLRYHGRIDDNWKTPSQVTKKEYEAAIRALLSGGVVASDQKPAMGCSIKWK